MQAIASRDAQSEWSCEPDLLDLVERHVVGTTIVELGGARRGVTGNVRCPFDGAAVLEIRGDAGRAETVIADACRDSSAPGFRREPARCPQL